MSETAAAESMYALLVNLADAKIEVQVKLRDYTPTPLGPGVIEMHPLAAGIFKIVTEVVQHTPGQFAPVKKEMLMPFLFAAADVLWVSEPPIEKPKELVKGVGLYGGGS